MPTALVTVGSTSFDRMIRAVDSLDALDALQGAHEITDVVIQFGAGEYVPAQGIRSNGITVTAYRFKLSLKEDMERADLVVSHAGSGSVMEALTMGKNLVTVVNRELMDDHQKELADVVEEERYAFKADVSNLAEVLKTANFATRIALPERNRLAVSKVLLQESIQ